MPNQGAEYNLKTNQFTCVYHFGIPIFPLPAIVLKVGYWTYFYIGLNAVTLTKPLPQLPHHLFYTYLYTCLINNFARLACLWTYQGTSELTNKLTIQKVIKINAFAFSGLEVSFRQPLFSLQNTRK